MPANFPDLGWLARSGYLALALVGLAVWRASRRGARRRVSAAGASLGRAMACLRLGRHMAVGMDAPVSDPRYLAQGPQVLRDGKPYVTILADAPEHKEAARVIAGLLAALFALRQGALGSRERKR